MTNNNLIQARWLTLLIFPIGYLLTEEAFSYAWVNYAALNILSFTAGVIILWRLRKMSLENLVVWFVWFVMLVGYYYKFYFLVHGFLHEKSKLELSLYLGSIAPLFASKGMLFESFVTITVSFFAVAISSHFLLRRRGNIVQFFKHENNVNVNWPLITNKLLAVAFLLWMVSGYLRKYYYLGVPYAAVYLPYKLAGLITVTNGIIVPMLINLALLNALRSGRRQLIHLSAVIFIIWGIVEFILFSSKTYLVLPLIIIYAAGVLYRRPIFKMKYIAWYGGIFLLIYPFLNIFRSMQNYFPGRDILFHLSATLGVIYETVRDSGVFDFFFNSLGLMAGRVTGLDSMLVLAATRYEYSATNIIDYLSGRINSPEQIISGMHNIPFTGVAASLLGQAYFTTGSYIMTAAWTAGWLVFAYLITILLMKRNTLFTHNALLFWLVMVLQWSADGITYLKIQLFVFAILVSFVIGHFVGIGRRSAVRFNRT